MKRHTDIKSLLGLTIASVQPATVNNHYEALLFTFTDGSTTVIIGGGYDGCGDYIRVDTPEDPLEIQIK